MVMTDLTKVKIAHQEFCSKEGKKTPTAHDVFSLLQTHMVLNNVNATCPDIFRALTVEQTSMQSPAILAQRAQTLQTQGLFGLWLPSFMIQPQKIIVTFRRAKIPVV